MIKPLLKYAFVCLLCLLFACGGKKEEPNVPNYILSIDAFSNVLVDFSLAESAANLNIKNAATGKIDSVYDFNPLKENHIRKTQFDSSLNFYCNNSSLYKKVYEQVLAKLAEMEALNNLKKDSSKVNTK